MAKIIQYNVQMCVCADMKMKDMGKYGYGESWREALPRDQLPSGLRPGYG
ncbi:hypothetical protein [uncultured Mucilaginibacter sp.]|nr:hypothetical protein [uncultured Mucilaginibacter sp.]